MNPQIASQDTIREMELLFQRFHGDLPIPTYWKDPHGHFRGGNIALAELLQNTETNNVRPISPLEAISDIDLDPRLQKLDKAALEGTASSLTLEDPILLPSGKVIYISTDRVPLKDLQGNIIGILVTLTDITQQRENEHSLLRHQSELEQRNQSIEFDLDSARQIQKFLMGQQSRECPFLDISYRYQYMEKVGGDYINLRALDDNAFSLLLADLTGHGVTAALFMALLKYISQEAPEQVRSLPAYFLSYLDMEFYGQIPNGFFTAFSATARYEEETQTVEIQYANAAHPCAVIVRSEGSCETLNTGDFAIGLLDFIERTSFSATLNPGDRLYVFTDGFVETRDPNNEEFGSERLLKLFRQTKDLPIEDSIKSIFDGIANFRGDDICQDDMTLIGLQAKVQDRIEKCQEALSSW